MLIAVSRFAERIKFKKLSISFQESFKSIIPDNFLRYLNGHISFFKSSEYLSIY